MNNQPYDPNEYQTLPMQSRRKPHKRLWAWYQHQRNIAKVGIGCGILLVAGLACCIASVAIAGPTGTQSPQTQSIATSVPTATPTSAAQQVVTQKKSPTSTAIPTPRPTPTKAVVVPPTPTPKPTNTPVPAATAPILGANINAFTAKYGQPDSHTDKVSGSYHFQKYSDSNTDFLIAWTDLADGGADAQKIYSLSVQADTNGWSKDKATATCAPFLPRDAVAKSKVNLNDGSGSYDQTYYSASLAKMFPAADFTDANTNPVQPGMFDMQVQISPNATVSGCSIQLGTQQTQ